MNRRTLGPEPDEWNEVAVLDTSRSHIEREWERNFWRSQLPTLDPTEVRVLGFIKSRTLDWQKYAESIPMGHFRFGLTDTDGSLALGKDGRPLCAGTGIKKEDTIRECFQRLQAKGLITIFPGRSGTVTPANVYMPFSRQDLARQLVATGGVLPQSYEEVLIGEHHVASGCIWRVEHHHHGALLVRELRPTGITGRPMQLAFSDFRRPSVEEWIHLRPKEEKKDRRWAAQRSNLLDSEGSFRGY